MTRGLIENENIEFGSFRGVKDLQICESMPWTFLSCSWKLLWLEMLVSLWVEKNQLLECVVKRELIIGPLQTILRNSTISTQPQPKYYSFSFDWMHLWIIKGIAAFAGESQKLLKTQLKLLSYENKPTNHLKGVVLWLRKSRIF